MTESTLFEFESEHTGREVATLLHELADGFESEGTLVFGDEVALAAPSTVEVEIEVETDDPDEGPTEVEVELEFEWETDDPEATVGSGDVEAGGGTDDSGDVEAGGGTDDSGDVEAKRGADDDGEAIPVDAAAVSSLAQFQLYRDRGGEWRWRLVHRNGNIIATGGEGYSSRHNARKGLRSVVANAPGAEVDVEGVD